MSSVQYYSDDPDQLWLTCRLSLVNFFSRLTLLAELFWPCRRLACVWPASIRCARSRAACSIVDYTTAHARWCRFPPDHGTRPAPRFRWLPPPLASRARKPSRSVFVLTGVYRWVKLVCAVLRRIIRSSALCTVSSDPWANPDSRPY